MYQELSDDELLRQYRDLDQEIKAECWQVFCAYNIHDVELVDRLDDKMKLMDLVLTMAYDAKVNYEDVFSPVKTWDIIIYNYLNDRRTVIPQRRGGEKSQAFEGAYVKDPLVGKHYWVVSLDVNSMYPHIIMGWNMSPETIQDLKYDVSVNQVLDGDCDFSEARNQNLAVAGNGCTFSRDKKGLMPTLMQLYYDRRTATKKQMISEKQKVERIQKEIARRSI